MAETDAIHWYALKVFYNKVFDIESMMRSRGIDSYIPVRKDPVKGERYLSLRRKLREDGFLPDIRYAEDGNHIVKRVPVISSLMFIRCEEEELKRLVGENLLEGKAMIYKTADRERFAVIPDRQMAAFRLVAESGESGLDFYSEESITRYKQGARVRVKSGPLKGAEGYVKRIHRDRRLLVSIEGIVAVATTFIPPDNLEVVEETSI